MNIREIFLTGVSAGLAIVLLSTGAKASVTYNAVADFSNTNGGTNPWSYGYNIANAGASPTLLDEYLPGLFSGQLDAWHNTGGTCCGGNSSNNSVLIGKNTTGGTIFYETIAQPNNYLEQDPESNKSVDLVFTAQQAGLYAISFGFLGIDTQAGNQGAGHGVDVLVNGLVTKSGFINTYGSVYDGSFSALLAAGDTLDFQTLTSPTTFAYLSTGVQAEITLSTVPLPASFPMFGGALLALAGLGYGMNRWVAPKNRSDTAAV